MTQMLLADPATLADIRAALTPQHHDLMLQCKDSGIPKLRPRAREDRQ